MNKLHINNKVKVKDTSHEAWKELEGIIGVIEKFWGDQNYTHVSVNWGYPFNIEIYTILNWEKYFTLVTEQEYNRYVKSLILK